MIDNRNKSNNVGSLSPESEEENLSQYLDDLSTSPRFVNIDYSGTQLGPHNVHLITTGVHLGNAYAAKDKQFLVQNGFTHVLNAAEGTHPWCQVNTNQDYYIDTKITYFGIPAYDSFTWDMSVHFDEAALFIDDVVRNGGKYHSVVENGSAKLTLFQAKFWCIVELAYQDPPLW
jgi:hypothetical protein